MLRNDLVIRYGTLAYIFLYGLIFSLSLQGFDSLFSVLVLAVLKCFLVGLFGLIMVGNSMLGLNLFFFSTMLLGFNGSIQKIVGEVNVSVIFLVLLLGAVLLKEESRQHLFITLKISTFRWVFILSGIVVPTYGLLWGLLRGNNFSYILRDADGWFFYTIFFVMVGMINSTEKFHYWLRNFMSAIFVSVLLHLLFVWLFIHGFLTSSTIQVIYYSLLNIGGHFSETGYPVIRLYTSTGIFVPLLLSYGIFCLYFSRGPKTFYHLCSFLCGCISLFFQYTRGFWFMAIFSLFFGVSMVPSHAEKKFYFIYILLLLTIFLSQVTVFEISIADIIEEEWTKISASFREIETELFDGNKRNLVKSSMEGDFPTTMKAKQYYALITFTNKKPLSGYGFGATLPDNITFRTDNGEAPYNFEAGYGSLLMKIGYVGFLIWFGLIAQILFIGVRILRQFSLEDRMISALFLFPFMGLIFAYATNPYIFSPFGIIPLVVTTFVMDFVLRNAQPETEI